MPNEKQKSEVFPHYLPGRSVMDLQKNHEVFLDLFLAQ